MKDSIIRISLDVQDNNSLKTIQLKQGDTAKQLEITLADGGFPYELSSECYAVLTAEKPDGNTLYNGCEIIDGKIFYNCTEQTTAAAGKMTAELKVYGRDDQVLTSAFFRIVVNGTVFNDHAAESTSEFSALSALMTETAAALEDAANATQLAGDAASRADQAAENAQDAADTVVANTEDYIKQAADAAVNASSSTEAAARYADAAYAYQTAALESSGWAAASAEQAKNIADHLNADVAANVAAATDAAAAAANYKTAAQQAAIAADSSSREAGLHAATAENARSAAAASAEAAQNTLDSAVNVIRQEGEYQVETITDVGQQKLNAIIAEGGAQIGAIGNAGGSQISAIIAEGNEQRDNVTKEGTRQIQDILRAGNDELSKVIGSSAAAEDAAEKAAKSATDADWSMQQASMSARSAGSSSIDAMEFAEAAKDSAAEAKSTADAFAADVTNLTNSMNGLKEDLADISGNSKNLFAQANVKLGYSLKADGVSDQVTPENGYTVDYIEMVDGLPYSISGNGGQDLRIFYYDEDKKLKGTSIIQMPFTISAQRASKYFRINFKRAFLSETQIEIGKPTPYVPAKTANDSYLRKEYELYGDAAKRAGYLYNDSGTVITIAPSNALDADKKSSTYVCDGTNDSDVLQDAVDSLIARGGGKIILKKGRFFLSKIFDSHYFLKLNTGSTIVEIESEIYNYNLPTSKGQETGTGAQLYVTDAAYESLSDDGYAVISVWGNSLSGGAIIRNIGIVWPYNQKKIVGVDFKHCNGLCVAEGLYINAYNKTYNPSASVGSSVGAAADGCIGIRTCIATSLGSPLNHYKNCIVKGCYEGFAINNEHQILEECASLFCVYGYTFGRYDSGYGGNQGQHPHILLRCMDERNINLPKFFAHDKKQAVQIIGFNIERKPQYSPDGICVDYAVEERPGDWYGEVSFTGTSTENGDTGLVNSTALKFWAPGSGHNFKTVNLTHRQACTSAERLSYSPSYMERLYDLTLGKEVICVDESAMTWVDCMGNSIGD